MPAPTKSRGPDFVGMGRASQILERGPSVLMRLALVGEVQHEVCSDGRLLFSVADVRTARGNLPPKQRRGV
jgi:hypothetical protein